MISENLNCDVCIVGGGMVGATAAIGFAKLGLDVVVLERSKPEAFDVKQAPDLRVSALNHFSLNLLEKYDIWERVEKMRFRDYEQLDAWESTGHLTSFKASEIGETRLGSFVENRILQLAIVDVIETGYRDSIRIIYGHRVVHIDHVQSEIKLENGYQIQCKLLVGADGAQSLVRKSAGIGDTGWDYTQSASLITIKSKEPFENCTWQQFTPQGPLAFLPMHQNYACLVWYGDKSKTAEIKGASSEELTNMIGLTFPSRLSAFEVLDRGSFPLRRMHANTYFQNKTVLIGDAAHTINPLAGQGVNLGFRDVGALIESIKNNGLELKQIEKALSEYSSKRRLQNLAMMSAMDAIYHTFSNENWVLKKLRNIGLSAADKAGPLKITALKYAVGIK